MQFYPAILCRDVASRLWLKAFAGRGAAAIAAAALELQQRQGDAHPMLLLPAARSVADGEAFRAALGDVQALATAEQLVVLGLRPTAPVTGCDYLELGPDGIQRYIDQPSLSEAVQFLGRDSHVLNTGVYCASVGAIVAALRVHCPEVLPADSRGVPAASPLHVVAAPPVLAEQRPWGSYTILDAGSGYKVKRIDVKPGAALSLQLHHHRSEHWIVVQGTAHVVNGDQRICLGPNASTYIEAGQKHRLENRAMTDLVMIEVQSGHYLGEDDIVRFQDHYGRA